MSRKLTRGAWIAFILVWVVGGIALVRPGWGSAHGAPGLKKYSFKFPFTNDVKDTEGKPIDVNDLHVVWERKPTKAIGDKYDNPPGKPKRMRLQAGRAEDGKPMTTHDRVTVPASGSVEIDTEWEGPDDDPSMLVAYWWTLGGIRQGQVRDGYGSERGDAYPWPAKHGSLPEGRRLPEGAIFASADVTENTKIEIKEPGYACVATAEVVEIKRVAPGDTLNAKSASAIVFDDGRGVLINIAKVGAGLAAVVGVTNLLDRGHPSSIPVHDNSTTMVVGSDKPFSTAEVVTQAGEVLPSTTYAEFSTLPGVSEEHTHLLLNVKGIKTADFGKVSVRTRAASGAVIEEVRVGDGILNGTPRVAFDQKVYRRGQPGTLRIENLQNYAKGKALTGFGLANNLTGRDIVIRSTNANGLPSKVRFDPSKDPLVLSFKAGRPGAVEALVYLPGTVPPQPAPAQAAPSAGEHLTRAYQAFDVWRKIITVSGALTKANAPQAGALLNAIDPDSDLADNCYQWTCPSCGHTWTCYLKFCPKCWAEKNGKKEPGKKGSKVSG